MKVFEREEELLEIAEHLVLQRLEYSDYYDEELEENFNYTKEENDFILDNIFTLLKEIQMNYHKGV
jgi:hypothetical protein